MFTLARLEFRGGMTNARIRATLVEGGLEVGRVSWSELRHQHELTRFADWCDDGCRRVRVAAFAARST
jgi:hypothetical protein